MWILLAACASGGAGPAEGVNLSPGGDLSTPLLSVTRSIEEDLGGVQENTVDGHIRSTFSETLEPLPITNIGDTAYRLMPMVYWEQPTTHGPDDITIGPEVYPYTDSAPWLIRPGEQLPAQVWILIGSTQGDAPAVAEHDLVSEWGTAECLDAAADIEDISDCTDTGDLIEWGIPVRVTITE